MNDNFTSGESNDSYIQISRQTLASRELSSEKHTLRKASMFEHTFTL